MIIVESLSDSEVIGYTLITLTVVVLTSSTDAESVLDVGAVEVDSNVGFNEASLVVEEFVAEISV